MSHSNRPSTNLDLNITFWGVRGSLAAPGESTRRIGGNTSCVEVTYGETTLLFDAGTGIRRAGTELMKRKKNHIHLLFSHLHWDHIQGFPFFTPAYVPGTHLEVFGPAPEEELQASLSRQMRPPNFPIVFEDLKSDIQLREVLPGVRLAIGDCQVTATHLNHPGGVLGYRVENEDRAIVYSTDHEHGTDADERLIELAHGADILIYDAMYTPEEYRGESGPPKIGWGHSTFEEATRVAVAAGVKQLVLFHHDPERDDDQVDDIIRRARELFPNTIAAQEGRTLVAGSNPPPSVRNRAA